MCSFLRSIIDNFQGTSSRSPRQRLCHMSRDIVWLSSRNVGMRQATDISYRIQSRVLLARHWITGQWPVSFVDSLWLCSPVCCVRVKVWVCLVHRELEPVNVLYTQGCHLNWPYMSMRSTHRLTDNITERNVDVRGAHQAPVPIKTESRALAMCLLKQAYLPVGRLLRSHGSW
jgi:hypothetical protein